MSTEIKDLLEAAGMHPETDPQELLDWIEEVRRGPRSSIENAPRFADNGDAIDGRLAKQSENACTACGGSGHRDDQGDPHQMARGIIKYYDEAPDDAAFEETHPVFQMALHIDSLKKSLEESEICGLLHELQAAQGHWADRTFGLNRDPRGPIAHLRKEVREWAEDPEEIEECADCMLLTLDAARLAGFSAGEIVRAGFRKLDINRNRKWGAPDENGVVEHIREEGGAA